MRAQRRFLRSLAIGSMVLVSAAAVAGAATSASKTPSGVVVAPSGGRGGGGHDGHGGGGHDDRGGHYDGHSRGHYGSRGHGGYGWGWGIGWYGPSWYGSWYGAYPWWGPGYVYAQPYGYGGGDMGALDFDVAPEDAEIYVDGSRVGTADDFDGYPTYLWLERGTYDVVIYRPGYATIARQYVVRPGIVIDVDDQMQPGDARRPEDLPSPTHVRRDARIEDDRRKEAEVDRRDARREREDDRDWRDRSPRGGSAEALPRRSEDAPAEAPSPGAERSDRGGTLKLDVTPDDAAVYLDGRLVGAAEAADGLALDRGEHVLEVVRPGFAPERQRFEVSPGETVTLQIELERGDD